MTDASANDITAIRELFTEYTDAWAANDAARIAGFWDRSDPYPLYKAEEIGHFLTDWSAIFDYWEVNEQLHETIRLRFSKFNFKPLNRAEVMVTAHMRWDIRFALDAALPDGTPFMHRGKAMGGDNHVLALIRKTGGTWKFATWSETPDAPITYVRRLYEKSAQLD